MRAAHVRALEPDDDEVEVHRLSGRRVHVMALDVTVALIGPTEWEVGAAVAFVRRLLAEREGR